MANKIIRNTIGLPTVTGGENTSDGTHWRLHNEDTSFVVEGYGTPVDGWFVDEDFYVTVPVGVPKGAYSGYKNGSILGENGFYLSTNISFEVVDFIVHVNGEEEATISVGGTGYWTTAGATGEWDAGANSGAPPIYPYEWQKTYDTLGDYTHTFSSGGDDISATLHVVPAEYPPDTPDAPATTGHDCEAHSVTLASPLWPGDNDTTNKPVVSIELWRVAAGGNVATDGVLIGSFESEADTIDDETVVTPNHYDYYARAVNEEGNSAFSEVLEVAFVSGMVLAFLAPAAVPLRELVQVAVQVTPNGVTLDELHVFFGSDELVMQQAEANPNIWFCDLDTDALLQGPATFSAWAIDTGGCKTEPVSIPRTLDNTLRASVRWLQLSRTDELVAQGVQAHAKLLPSGADGTREDCIIEFGILSPAPTAPAEGDYTDEQLAALDTAWINWQKIRLDANVPLLRTGEPGDDGEYSEGAYTAALRARCQRRQRIDTYEVAAPVTRFIAEEERVLAFAGARIYCYDEDGWSLWRDISAILPDAFSLALRGDKIFAVTGSGPSARIVSIDVDSGDAAFSGAALGETKPALFAEYWSGPDVVVLAYSDGTSTTLWQQKTDQVKKIGDIAGGVTLLRAAGDTLAVACDGVLWTVKAGGTPVERLEVLSPITMLAPQENGAVIFGTESGSTRVLAAEASSSTELDVRAFPVRAYATFGKSGETPRPVIGGDDANLFRKSPVSISQSAFVVFQTFGEDEQVSAMATFTEGNGATIVESLFVAVLTEDGGYVSRVQAITPGAKAYLASDIAEIVLSPTQFV
jgi:hypothetical protein